jgi:uncharacterized protein YndB with AHSA1/START domain
MTKKSKLEVTLPNDLEVHLKRVFDAPPNVVFDAWTKPEIITRWMLGPPGWTMPVCEMDLRAGGKFRWRWRGEKGEEFGFTGVFREVTRPARIVHTEVYDPGDVGGNMGGEALVTSEFAPQGGATLHTMTIRYQSKADRDAAVKTGMTDGMEIGNVRLDEILASTASAAAQGS